MREWEFKQSTVWWFGGSYIILRSDGTFLACRSDTAGGRECETLREAKAHIEEPCAVCTCNGGMKAPKAEAV